MRVSGMARLSTTLVDVAAMPYGGVEDKEDIAVDCVDDVVLARSHPPRTVPLHQLLGTARSPMQAAIELLVDQPRLSRGVGWLFP